MQEVIAPVWAVPFAKRTTNTNTTTSASTNRYYVTPEIETGNQLIDSEHRQIFDAVNELLDACSSGNGRQKISEMAEFLANYVGKHFADEEKLQKKYQYPNMEKHMHFHIDYKRRVREFVAKIKNASDVSIQDVGELNALASRLVNHIRQEDKRLAAYIREHSK